MNPKHYISKRSGKIVKQSSGYHAFIVNPLPPNPELIFDKETIKLLAEAEQMLGRLNAIANLISDADLFVYLYVRKEALMSSQIEGTQCSLEDILTESNSKTSNADVEEVSNYVQAMNKGLKRLDELPISNRLIKEIHTILMKGVRGANKTPGEFRTSQNGIGRPEANLETALFVPPPTEDVKTSMSDLEKYIHMNDDLSPLIRSSLIHAQFETIHPFLDGNGRLGRLLITFLLCHWGVLEKPLLYLSYFFKANRTEYYSKLMDIRTKGDWESWVKFFLRGVIETAQIANQTALDIHSLHEKDREKLKNNNAPASVLKLFTAFCNFPVSTVPELMKLTHISNQVTINRALVFLIDQKLVHQISEGKRNRKFSYKKYLEILTRDTIEEMG
jgi:Fic family protein